MFGNSRAERLRNQIKGGVPIGIRAVDFGVQKSPLKISGFPKCGSFGTQPSKIRRMIGVTFDRAISPGQNPAAHAAIGTCGAGQAHAATPSRDRARKNARSNRMRPFATRAG